MMTGIQAFIEKFKTDKTSAILAFLFLAAFGISNNSEVLNGFPESWRGPIASICGIIKGGCLGYAILYSTGALTNKELEKKLTTIQADPNQTVIPSRELVVASGEVAKVAELAPHLEQVVDVIPQLQKVVAVAPVIAKVAETIEQKKYESNRKD